MSEEAVSYTKRFLLEIPEHILACGFLWFLKNINIHLIETENKDNMTRECMVQLGLYILQQNQQAALNLFLS